MIRRTPLAALVLLALTAGLQGCASQRSSAAELGHGRGQDDLCRGLDGRHDGLRSCHVGRNDRRERGRARRGRQHGPADGRLVAPVAPLARTARALTPALRAYAVQPQPKPNSLLNFVNA